MNKNKKQMTQLSSCITQRQTLKSMKKIFFTLLFLLPVFVLGQSQNQNYVKSTTYKKASTQTIIDVNDPTHVAVQVNYVDGLGRPIQQIVHKQSASGKDIINHIEYDDFGRQTKEFLPYVHTNTNANYDPNGGTNTLNFYATNSISLTGNPNFETTTNPFSEKELEASPLGRVFKQAAPGNAWALGSGHEIKMDYQTNSAGEVKHYKAVTTWNATTKLYDISFVYNGNYAANELYKTVTKDENWSATQPNSNDHTTVEFKNKEGQVVLKRNFDNNRWHNTYYVYDDYGNLTYVLSPEMNTYPLEQYDWQNQPSIELNNIETVYTFSPAATWNNQGAISLANNTFVVAFIGLQNQLVTLNTTSAALDLTALGFNVSLPDANLGPIGIQTSLGAGYDFSHYSAYLQNNKLYITGDGTPVYGLLMDINFNLNTLTGDAPTTIANDDIDKLGYQYKYDYRNRLVEKKLPGKDWEYIIYDKLDRPILTQDANLKAKNKWLFTKYDVFGRIAYTGLWTTTPDNDRATIQNNINNQPSPVWFETKLVAPITIAGTSIYYSNVAFPNFSAIDEIEILTIQYYDNYEVGNQISLNPAVTTSTWEGMVAVANVKGLPTVSRVKVLETNHWITTASYYDNKGRVWETHVKNDYLATEDWSYAKLDFTGKVLKTKTTHTKAGITTTVEDFFTYDHAERLLTQKQKINAQPEQLIVKNTYDELGQLIKKGVGNNEASPLQNVDYSYNIRGWLKNINDLGHLGNDLFAFNLNYQEQNTPYNYNGAPGESLFNGNISGTRWITDNNTSTTLRSYYYKYDALNRIKDAHFEENDKITNRYNERITGYDRNGNIKGLIRQSSNPNYNTPPVWPNPSSMSLYIDALNYTYDGNRLLAVKDNVTNVNSSEEFKDGNTVGNDYFYDANGNMIADKNKNITKIEYNHLNLPTKIVFNNQDLGVHPYPKTIVYKYDANGVKIEKKVLEPIEQPISTLPKTLSKSEETVSKSDVINGRIKMPSPTYVNTTKVIHYAGNYIYENNVLQFFSQPEGYVSNNSGMFSYVFQYKDHLGNVRLSYADSNNDGIITGGSTELFYDGFESASGWNSTGALYGGTVSAYDTTRKHSGNTSGKIEKLTAGELYVHSNTWVPISNTAPTEYIFSGWVYAENTSAEIFLCQKTATETAYNTTFENIITYERNRWVYLEKRVTIQPNIATINLRIDNNGGGTVWFDDLSIRKVNPTNEIVEENNYYPFGLKHKGYNNLFNLANANALAQQYKYNGKELQDELGLNWYDYGARNYDAAIGRWMNIDPLAEHNQSFTVFHYCSNNPVSRIDPDGRCDDPNCTHGAIRKGWDRVGRFFGAWGYSENTSATQQSSVSSGEVTLLGIGDAIGDGLQSTENWFQSIHGTSTVNEDAIQSFNAGASFSFEYNGTNTEIQFGLYSTSEDSFGFYNSTSESIGIKGSTSGVNLFEKLPTFGANLFASANTDNPFNGQTYSSEDKGVLDTSLKLGRFSAVGITTEKNIKTSEMNSSYKISAGTNASSDVSGSIVNTTTVINKTREFN